MCEAVCRPVLGGGGPRGRRGPGEGSPDGPREEATPTQRRQGGPSSTSHAGRVARRHRARLPPGRRSREHRAPSGAAAAWRHSPLGSQPTGESSLAGTHLASASGGRADSGPGCSAGVPRLLASGEAARVAGSPASAVSAGGDPLPAAVRVPAPAGAQVGAGPASAGAGHSCQQRAGTAGADRRGHRARRRRTAQPAAGTPQVLRDVSTRYQLSCWRSGAQGRSALVTRSRHAPGQVAGGTRLSREKDREDRSSVRQQRRCVTGRAVGQNMLCDRLDLPHL